MATTITQVAKAMQKILTEVANRVGRESELIKRQVKLSGASFAQLLVFGWMKNPNATLEEITQMGVNQGIKISPQGLDQRFGEESVKFAQELLAETVKIVVSGEAVAIELLNRFTDVVIHDSTVVGLPKCLEAMWPGCGNQEGTAAAIKFQVGMSLKYGTLKGPFPKPGKEVDVTGAIPKYVELAVGSVWFGDLGYWDLKQVLEFITAGVDWFSRYKVDVAVFDRQGNRLDLIGWLKQQTATSVELAVELGIDHRVPCRLIAVRVSDEVAARRRTELRRQAREKGFTVSPKRLALADWVIYVTTIPATKLSIDDALVFGAIRWQVELLFKLWKSYAGIDVSRSQNPNRVLTEIFLKLVGVVIEHWVMITGTWAIPDRSLFKAVKTIQTYVITLAISFHNLFELSKNLKLIHQCLQAGCRLNKRKKKPLTFQRLLARSVYPELVETSEFVQLAMA
jgi:hypothetical protein